MESPCNSWNKEEVYSIIGFNPHLKMKRLTAILAITGATVLAISAVPLPASAWEYYSPSSSQYQIQRSNGWSSGSYFGW